MKVVILAGGLGTRMGDETLLRPKPLIEIGGHPILWHIMNIYAAFGFEEFVVALGYRGDLIKDYFINFEARNSDFTIDLGTGRIDVLQRRHPRWKVHLIDTGLETQTGGRLLRLRDVIGDERFMLTYGDGLARIDVRALVAWHERNEARATLTAVRPPARFGNIRLADDGARIENFVEKPQTDAGWINGGFFVFEPAIFDYIDGDTTPLEREPLERLAADGGLFALRHDGFWQPMDTARERRLLEDLWESGRAPWKVWSDASAAVPAG
ncbi:MAG TPA: glucose-1-phosphate cytidylyltransferase [Candidatus Elarobacter sp.]